MSTQLAPIVGPEATSILTVLKVKLKNQLLYAEFTEQHDKEASPRAFTMQGTELVHPDLQHRLSHLVPHLCLLTEQLTEPAEGARPTPAFWPADEAEQLPELFQTYTVTGFSMGRGQAGVTLIGQRQLAGGKVLNLTSPYLAFEDENTTYPYAGRLETAVLDAISEVEATLRGKCSEAGRQLDLFDGADPDQEPRLLSHDEAREYVPEVVAEEQQPVKKRKANRIAK